MIDPTKLKMGDKVVLDATGVEHTFLVHAPEALPCNNIVVMNEHGFMFFTQSDKLSLPPKKRKVWIFFKHYPGGHSASLGVYGPYGYREDAALNCSDYGGFGLTQIEIEEPQ